MGDASSASSSEAASRCGDARPSALRRVCGPRLVLAAAALAGCALIAWSSLGEWQVPKFGPPQKDYYNLLAAGFRKGSLALDMKVPDALRNAENPWDPLKRPANLAPHDVSYFRGRYYIYFGVAPVVALFLPFRLITGHDLPLVYGTLAYSLGAFLVAAWLWLRVLRDHFPGASLATRVAGMLAIGLAGGQLVLARRISIWEPPIAAGHFYTVGMLAFGYLALRSRRPWGWLAACGLYLGLAVGSRPSLAAAGAGLAVIVLAVCAKGRGERGMLRRCALAVGAAGLPLAAVLAGLLAYNDARFGNPFEFGINYQLSSVYEAHARHFRLSYAPFNFRAYFLKPPQWGRYFPFLHPIALPDPPPAGYYGIEYVYGALAVCPVLLWALCLAVRPRARRDRAELPPIAGALVAIAVATTAVLLCFNTAAARYTVDFLPWWVWLGALGWAVLERGFAVPALLRAAFVATAAFSVLLGFLQGCDIHGLLRNGSPGTYTRISRMFDLPTAFAERLIQFRGGPIEMDATFSGRPAHAYEPLVVTGVENQRDYVFAYFPSETVVRFGFASSGGGVATGSAIALQPGRTYRMRVECGSLYPPQGHPIYDGWSPVEIHSVKNWVRIELDGRAVLDERMPGNEASPGSLRIGRDQPGGIYGDSFLGTLARVRRGPWRRSLFDPSGSGDFELKLTLPGDAEAGNQPLIVAGRTGRADLVGMKTLDRRHIAFLYESWGAGIWQSGPIALAEDRSASLRIRFGPLLRIDESSPLAILGRSLVVWKDGTPVWWYRMFRQPEPHPALGLFANTIGSSAMIPEFQGRVDSAGRDPAPRAWRGGPFAAVEAELAGRGDAAEPLVGTGSAGREDTLAIRWLPGGRAQFLYDHSGEPLRTSGILDWPEGTIHRLRAALPSLPSLDAPSGAVGTGRIRVDLDGRRAWEETVPFFPAPSASVAVGRNGAGSACAGAELTCVVVGLRQAFR